MNIETLKDHYRQHSENKEKHLAAMEQSRLNMLACDGAMQGLKILIDAEERATTPAAPQQIQKKNKPQKP